MASWIKWAKGLIRRPEVLQIASRLGRSPREVAAILMELWEWADDNVVPENESAKCPGFVRIVSGNCPPIDGILSVDGLTKCLVDVGWLIVHEDRIEFPKFGRHNGKSAKQRALDAERVAERRARSPQNVRVLSGLKPDGIATRGEEIRGDLNNPSISPQGESASQADAKPETPRKRKPRQPLPATLAEPFNVWWKTYPRRTKPGDASRAYLSAINRLVAVGQSEEQAIATLQEAAAAFAPFGKTQGVYCPYPASWLNGEQYHDDRATWKPDSTGQARASDLPRQRSFESLKIITNKVGPDATEAAANRLLDLGGG